ncbi:hypothetical protein BJ165DRAFT_1533645 [Panaeolus papilionaceus]|nr:hypothetical protein BJ165DRAFT_1533645 [Panaeolus papilionaceus]
MQFLSLATIIAVMLMTSSSPVAAVALPEPEPQITCRGLSNFCISSNQCCGYPKVICRGPTIGAGTLRCLYPDQAYPGK